MENEPNNSTITMKKSNKSISNADSLPSQVELFYTPPHDFSFRSDSPLHSDSPLLHPDSKAIVAVDKYYSPLRSLPPTNNKHNNNNLHCPPPVAPPATVSQSSKVIYNRSVKEELVSGVTKVGPAGGEEEGGVVGGRKSRASISSRSRKDMTVERATLGLRVSEVIFSLISFSVMAADKTEGWSGDSFDRYKEYRYCLSVAVISFVYSGFQAYDLAYHLVTGKHVIPQHLRCHFDFLMDQILAYLLLSASSSAATRVDDWVSNWGKDQFTEMASASVGMAFLAFVAFALSSLVSGYNLCTRVSGGL